MTHEIYGKNQTIQILPSSLELVFEKTNSKDIPPIGLTVISNNNKGNASWIITDLPSVNQNSDWISRSLINIQPSIFNLTSNNITYSSLYLKNLSDISVGSYQGTLRLYHNNVFEEIPFKITIQETIPWYYSWYQFIWIFIGVAVSVFIQIIKIGYESRNSTLESLERCSSSIIRSITEKRMDNNFVSGQEAFMTGKQFFDKGQYKIAKEKFEKGNEFCNNARTISDPENFEFSIQPMSIDKILNIVDMAKIKDLVGLGLKDFDKFAIIISAIILFVLVMQLWNQVYLQISEFYSFTGVSYVGSFLIGFGSQSLVGQVIENLKSRYSHR